MTTHVTGIKCEFAFITILILCINGVHSIYFMQTYIVCWMSLQKPLILTFYCVCVYVCMCVYVCVWVQECVCHNMYVEVIRQPWGIGSLFPPWFCHIAYSRLPGLRPRCCVYRCVLLNLVLLRGPWGVYSAHQSGLCGQNSLPLRYLTRHPQKHSIGVFSEIRAESTRKERLFSVSLSSSPYSLVLLDQECQNLLNKNWWKTLLRKIRTVNYSPVLE